MQLHELEQNSTNYFNPFCCLFHDFSIVFRCKKHGNFGIENERHVHLLWFISNDFLTAFFKKILNLELLYTRNMVQKRTLGFFH